MSKLKVNNKNEYLKICEKIPNFMECQSSVVYENDEFHVLIEDGELIDIHHDFGSSNRGNIKGAYARIISKDGEEDIFSWKGFEEYCKDNDMWKAHPESMIKWCAESSALKEFISNHRIRASMD